VWLQLYTRITKQGWFDSNKEVYIFRGVIDDVNQFLAVCLLLLLYYYKNNIKIITGMIVIITVIMIMLLLSLIF